MADIWPDALVGLLFGWLTVIMLCSPTRTCGTCGRQ